MADELKKEGGDAGESRLSAGEFQSRLLKKAAEDMRLMGSAELFKKLILSAGETSAACCTGSVDAADGVIKESPETAAARNFYDNAVRDVFKGLDEVVEKDPHSIYQSVKRMIDLKNNHVRWVSLIGNEYHDLGDREKNSELRYCPQNILLKS